MKKVFLVIGIIVFFANISFAQDDKTVTVTVSGQGKTQEEAKQSALRNAIEQAFGAFISSKTEILNDELVKDEIVSVSNGNIQKFDILSEVQTPDGEWSNTVKAVVSVTKLTSFCESKGISVEFKGGLFAINVKQQQLNEGNEIKSIENMCKVLKEISDKSFDFEIEVKDPISLNSPENEWKVPLIVNVKTNNNFNNFNDYFVSTMKGVSLTKTEVDNYKQLEKPIYILIFTDKNGIKNEFYLRQKTSLMSIFDLFMYMKVSLSNFSISNGITVLTGDKIICSSGETDLLLTKLHKEDPKKAYEFEISAAYKYWDETHVNRENKIKDNFKPFIFNKERFSLFNLNPCISNPYIHDFGLYIPCDEEKFGRFSEETCEFSFSGIDFNKVLISYSFNDVRTLDELSKISEYKVSPILK